jgi:hypothetical protein
MLDDAHTRLCSAYELAAGAAIDHDLSARLQSAAEAAMVALIRLDHIKALSTAPEAKE